MRAVIYRPNNLRGSWRPRSLVDHRGPRFPEEYQAFLTIMDAESIGGVFDAYDSALGDVVFLGEGDELNVYVAAPSRWEIVKFGSEWRSPR